MIDSNMSREQVIAALATALDALVSISYRLEGLAAPQPLNEALQSTANALADLAQQLDAADAELFATTEPAAQHCAPVSETLRWGAAGAGRSVTSRPECEIFAASCRMPEALGAPQRFIHDAVARAAVNSCTR